MLRVPSLLKSSVPVIAHHLYQISSFSSLLEQQVQAKRGVLFSPSLSAHHHRRHQGFFFFLSHTRDFAHVAAEVEFPRSRRCSGDVVISSSPEERGRSSSQWQALPRSPLWKGRAGSKEALLVVRELMRYGRGLETTTTTASLSSSSWRLHLLIRSKVSRLLKLDLLAVLNELQRLEQVDLALMIFVVARREHWYKPEVYLYRDMLNCLGRNRRAAQARIVLDDAKREGIKPSPSLCSELMLAYLKHGMPCEAVEIFEEVKSAGACDRLIYNILIKELHRLGRFDLWLEYKKECKMRFWGEEFDGTGAP